MGAAFSTGDAFGGCALFVATIVIGRSSAGFSARFLGDDEVGLAFGAWATCCEAGPTAVNPSGSVAARPRYPRETTPTTAQLPMYVAGKPTGMRDFEIVGLGV